jgi:F-type H+-transporting ATPase subunit epsilon
MSDDTLQFELVTPERLVISQPVGMVEVPGEMGDFGVLPGHAPFMSIIRPGVVSVHEASGAKRYFFVPSGYAEVNPKGCTVLAERVRDLSEATQADADEELKHAKAELGESTDETRGRAEKALQVAEAFHYAVTQYR